MTVEKLNELIELAANEVTEQADLQTLQEVYYSDMHYWFESLTEDELLDYVENKLKIDTKPFTGEK